MCAPCVASESFQAVFLHHAVHGHVTAGLSGIPTKNTGSTHALQVAEIAGARYTPIKLASPLLHIECVQDWDARGLQDFGICEKSSFLAS